MLYYLMINGILSVVGAYISYNLIQEFIPIFVQRHLYGNDQCKSNDVPIPEPMGVVSAAIYLIILFIFIPFPFLEWTKNANAFPHDKFLAFLSALLSICSAILLGFADDILDLRWRHKLLFPTLSSLPVLMVYYLTGHSTHVILPVQFHFLFGSQIDIGFFYYIYMGMMVVFCTNAVNILAGINGLEAGQTLIIGLSIVIFNIAQLMRLETEVWHHYLSLYFLVPFLTINIVLLYYNWYPAQVFVGDTFCYWSGMTLAVVCILGHFSKTMALFLAPQIFNFLYSVPQLFQLLPCPRHRLPRFDSDSNCLQMSMTTLKTSQLTVLGRFCLRFFAIFHIVHWRQFEKDGESWTEINNLTLLNLSLKLFGIMPEKSLAILLLVIQIGCSLLAFFVRFYMASLIYDAVN